MYYRDRQYRNKNKMLGIFEWEITKETTCTLEKALQGWIIVKGYTIVNVIHAN